MSDLGMLKFGEGAGALPDFITPEAYIDLAQVIDYGCAYMSWQDNPLPEQALLKLSPPEIKQAIRIAAFDLTDEREGPKNAAVQVHLLTLTAHWLAYNDNQGDYTPTTGEIINFVFTTSWLIKSRFWAKIPS